MPRVPQYQPHQAGPAETTPARLRTTDNSFGIAGGIAAGLPRLAQALQDHGTREEEELRRDDAYARDLALGLQRDIGSLARDFAGLSGKAAADAGAEAKARILALESAALDQASNPRMRTMLENLSAGPLAQALDLVAAHSRRGLRQMGGEAARGERDLAIEGALAAHADPAVMAQARRQVIEANARLAEAEEWDEARFGEENARTLSDMHTRMVRAVLDDGGDVDLAGAYFEASRDEMAARDITLTEAALRGPRELADTARVVDEAMAAGTVEPGDTDTAFDLAGTIRHIKARTDLSEAQRQNALAQARKHHSVAQVALSDKHEAGRKAFDRWAEQADFDPALYVQDGEVPEGIRSQLSPSARVALDQLRDDNRARMELANQSEQFTEENQVEEWLAEATQLPDRNAAGQSKNGEYGWTDAPESRRHILADDRRTGAFQALETAPQFIAASFNDRENEALNQARQRFSLEGISNAIGDGIARRMERAGENIDDVLNWPAERYTSSVKATATTFISEALEDPRIGRAAREVLTSFMNGTGPRVFTYDLDDPNTSYGIEELFAHEPRGYFIREVTESLKYIMRKNKRDFLIEGDKLTRHTFSPFHSSFSNGSYDPTSGLMDGPQIGDVVGTMTQGWNVEVRRGRIYFTTANRTDLRSFAIGNLLPMVGNSVILPQSGPLSEVNQIYKFSIPIPNNLRQR